jgi:hypothetical protein
MTGTTNRRSGWGTILLGEATDLVDWKSVLAERFDPWVEVHGDDTVLRSQIFDESSSAEEVRTRALIQIQRLNGAVALALDTGVTSIRFGGVIEFGPDGHPQRTVNFAEMRASEQGDKAQMAFSVTGPDGKPIAATPRRSQVQDWMQLADNDDLLGDALIYFGRGTNWTFTRRLNASSIGLEVARRNFWRCSGSPMLRLNGLNGRRTRSSGMQWVNSIHLQNRCR